MDAQYLELSFEVDSSIKLASVEVPGSLFLLEAKAIRIEEISRREWGSKHKVTAFINGSVERQRIIRVAEILRERLVGLFALVTEADVSASDELMLVDPVTSVGEAFMGGGFRRQRSRLRAIQREYELNAKMQFCSILEWNALARFRKALMSETGGDAFEALVVTIDILGKNDYPGASGVSERMKLYLIDRLSVDSDSAAILIKARHKKIHENAFDPVFSRLVTEVKQKVIPDLSNRFGVMVVNRLRVEDTRLLYSHIKKEESSH